MITGSNGRTGRRRSKILARTMASDLRRGQREKMMIDAIDVMVIRRRGVPLAWLARADDAQGTITTRAAASASLRTQRAWDGYGCALQSDATRPWCTSIWPASRRFVRIEMLELVARAVRVRGLLPHEPPSRRHRRRESWCSGDWFHCGDALLLATTVEVAVPRSEIAHTWSSVGLDRNSVSPPAKVVRTFTVLVEQPAGSDGQGAAATRGEEREGDGLAAGDAHDVLLLLLGRVRAVGLLGVGGPRGQEVGARVPVAADTCSIQIFRRSG